MYMGVDESAVTTDQINETIHIYLSQNHVLQSGLHGIRKNLKIM